MKQVKNEKTINIKQDQFSFDDFLKKIEPQLKADLKSLREATVKQPALQILTTLACDTFLTDIENYREIDMKKSILEIEYLTWIFLTNKNQQIQNKNKVKNKKIIPDFVGGSEYKKIAKLLNSLMFGSLMSNRIGEKPESIDTSELKFRAKSWNLYVRSPAYEHHYKMTLNGLFNKFSKELLITVGFDLDSVFKVINFLDKECIKRINNRISKARKGQDEIRKTIQRIKSGEIKSQNESQIIMSQMDNKKFEKHLLSLSVAWAWLYMEEAFTFTVKEISKGSNVDLKTTEKIMNYFSLAFGQKEIGDSMPSRYDPLERSPLIKIDGDKYFCHLYTKLLWAIKSSFEKSLKSSRYWNKYEKHRSKYTESEALRLLGGALGGSRIYSNLTYQALNSNNKISTTELDGLIIFDSILFLVEVKAGDISPSARRVAPSSFKEDLTEIIKTAHLQSSRALNYINSSESVEFIKKDGTKLIIRKRNFTRKILLTLSLEDVAAFVTRMDILKKIGLLANDTFPWILSLDDLRVICEILNGAELVHYISRRLDLYNKPKIVVPDEIDCLGLYIKYGLCFEDPKYSKADIFSIVGMGEDLDNYFLYKQGFKKTKYDRPTQPIPLDLKKLVNQLSREQKQGFVEVVCSIFDGGDQARKDLLDMIKNRQKRSTQIKFASAVLVMNNRFFVVAFCDDLESKRKDLLEKYIKAYKVKLGMYGCGLIFNSANPLNSPIPSVNFEPFAPSRFEFDWANKYISQFSSSPIRFNT